MPTTISLTSALLPWLLSWFDITLFHICPLWIFFWSLKFGLKELFCFHFIQHFRLPNLYNRRTVYFMGNFTFQLRHTFLPNKFNQIPVIFSVVWHLQLMLLTFSVFDFQHIHASLTLTYLFICFAAIYYVKCSYFIFDTILQAII